MNLMRTWILLCAVGATCAVFADPVGKPRAVGIAPPTRIPAIVSAAPAGDAIAIAAVPRELRRLIVADAARRFGVERTAVVLARAEKMTWSDGSLGCADPGQTYAQVLISGFRVVAKTREGEFVYHTDTHGRLVVCAPPNAH